MSVALLVTSLRGLGAAAATAEAFMERTSSEPVRIGTTPSPKAAVNPTIPLDARITVRMPKGTVRTFLDEIARRSKIEFDIVGDVENCQIAALLHDVTVREALQFALRVRGMSYQQLGRSNHYTIVPREGGLVCPRLPPTRRASGSCKTATGGLILLDCKKAPLSEFADAVFERSSASFFLYDGAQDYPVTVQSKGADVERAMKKVLADDSLVVELIGPAKTYSISMRDRVGK